MSRLPIALLSLALLLGPACSDHTLPPVDGFVDGGADGTTGDSTGTCGPGTELCGDTCVNTDRDNAHCGQCDNPCDPGEVCSGGSCGLTCQQGLVKCGGACVDPLTDRQYCGASGDCQGANAGDTCVAGEVCSAGSCAVSCQQGLIECGGTCIDPTTDHAYCGASGDCAGANQGEACGADEVCSAGSCGLLCPSNLVKCGDPAKCIDPLVDPAFCGASGDCLEANAGETCTGDDVCSAGACALNCPGNLVKCNGTCIDPLVDSTYCGASADCQGANAGETCVGDDVCSAGSCQLLCPGNLVKCNGACIDPQTDMTYCGASADCQGANDGET